MKIDTTKRPWLVHALMSAVLLYAFEIGFAMLASLLIPFIQEIFDKSFRLGILAYLALILSPIGFVAIFHRAVSGAMDKFDARREKRGFFPGVVSLWAGCVAWFVSMLSTLIAAFLYIAIFPPPPDEETLHALEHLVLGLRGSAGVHTVIWILSAASLFAIERAARKSDD
jgi:hypothetical protein